MFIEKAIRCCDICNPNIAMVGLYHDQLIGNISMRYIFKSVHGLIFLSFTDILAVLLPLYNLTLPVHKCEWDKRFIEMSSSELLGDMVREIINKDVQWLCFQLSWYN